MKCSIYHRILNILVDLATNFVAYKYLCDVDISSAYYEMLQKFKCLLWLCFVRNIL